MAHAKKAPSIFSLTWLFNGLGKFFLALGRYIVRVLQTTPSQIVWVGRQTADSFRTVNAVSSNPAWAIATGFASVIAFAFWAFLGICRVVLLMRENQAHPHP